MRGYFVVGDLAYVKTEACVVPLLGEILEVGEGGVCKLKLCGYSPHSRVLPMYASAKMGDLDPSSEVLKRWEGKGDVIVENNMKADIDKLAKELEEHLGTKKISVRLW